MKGLEDLLPGASDLRARYLVELADLHKDYTERVSWAGRALSLEAAATVAAVAHLPAVRSALDLGSGFSSAVFRLLKAEGVLENVQSIDDDPEWLERSRAFCQERGLGSDDFALWDPENRDKHDLVLYDLGSIHTRAIWVDRPRKLCRPDGIVFYDDLHKAPYATLVGAETLRARTYDVGAETLDSFGRFGLLAQLV